MLSSSVRSLALLALILLLAPVSNTLAAEGSDGNWELNVAKSKFNPGPPPKSQSRTYRTEGDMQSVTIRSVDAKGESTTSQASYRFDGKDYPVKGGEIDAIAMTKVDDATVHGTAKRAGKTAFSVERKVSADGNSLTVVTKGTTMDGKPMHNVLVFDRK